MGFLLAKVFAHGGYHVFADHDYESRVRGGHNFFRVRARDGKVGAIAEAVDILIAFNRDSIELHQGELATQGIGVFDGDKIKDTSGNSSLLSVPLEKLSLKNKLLVIRLYFDSLSYDGISAKAYDSKGSVSNVIAELKAGAFSRIR